MTFSRLVLPNPEINTVPVRTTSHVSNQPFRSVEGGADGNFGPPNLASAGNASMSLSGSIDIAFSQEEDKHHWKCPMYLANFRVCQF